MMGPIWKGARREHGERCASRRLLLSQLSDADLLTNTRRLVGSSNQLFAALLAHLAEVEARGVHRTRAARASTPTASTSSECPRTPRSAGPLLPSP